MLDQLPLVAGVISLSNDGGRYFRYSDEVDAASALRGAIVSAVVAARPSSLSLSPKSDGTVMRNLH